MIEIPANTRERAILAEAHTRLIQYWTAFCASHDLPQQAVFQGVSETGVVVAGMDPPAPETSERTLKLEK